VSGKPRDLVSLARQLEQPSRALAPAAARSRTTCAVPAAIV